ncbi:MAG: efflux family protein [Firmicutes bacterium]|nr:efflux family protein [Bacillota bacterium]
MLPVMLQQMVVSLFNFVDNLMVGLVDAPTLAGVAVANKVYFIYCFIFFGLSGAGATLISQYFGAEDQDECERLFLLQVVIGLVIGILFVLLLTFFPRQILTIFVKDPVTVQVGLDYLSIVKFSYIPAALTMVCLFSLRAIGYNKMPMITGVVAILVNIALNWVLIFGHLGFPALGARGAAIATLIARMIEALCYLVWIGAGKTIFSWNLSRIRQLSAPVARMFVRKSIPLTVNEFLYSLGISVIFWSFSRVNETAIPALVITDQALQISLILFGGQTSAIAVLVGKRLGAGQFDQARINARLLLVFQGALAAAVMILSIATAPFLPRLFNIPVEIQHMATWLIIIQALFYVIFIVYANVFFILRAGGDMRSALLVDSAQIWLLPIPFAVLAALVWPGIAANHFLWFFLLSQALQNLRIVPCIHYFRRGHWVRNLTTHN